MKKSHKIIIAVFASILFVIAVVCLVGFTLGGKFGLIHLIIFAIVCIGFCAGMLFFINGKNFHKKKNFREAIIWISLALFVCCYACYGWMNYIGADNKAVTYNTVVEYTTSSKGSPTKIGFIDRDGDIGEANEYTVIAIGDDEFIDEGDTITVEQRNGGFNYKIYKIIDCKKAD